MNCVLFDLDGTIADTEVLKAKSLSLSVEKFGGKASAEIYKKVMGQSWEVVTGSFFKEAAVVVSLEDFNKIFREIYGQLIATELRETRSIAPFLQFLKSKKIRIGLVSSASPWMIEKVLDKLNLKNTFEVIVSGEDTSQHKPHPECYLMAMERLQVEASQTMAFEDSESGFIAAKAAGLTVYGVRHAYNESHSFAACSKTLENFSDFLSWELSSRFF